MEPLTKRFNCQTSQVTVLFLLMGLVCTYPLLPFASSKAVNRFQVDQWDARDGLPFSQVRSIRQTKDGYLWMISASTLYRFDGVKFEPIILGPKHDPYMQTRIYLDREDILWVGSNHGILHRYRNNRFEEVISKTDSLKNFHITGIYKDSHANLWLGSISHLIRYSNGTITRYKDIYFVTGIFEDSRSNLWVSSLGSGLSLFKNGSFVSYPIPQNETVTDLPARNPVHAILEDRAGLLWVSTSHGLYAIENPLSAGTKKIHRFKLKNARAPFEDHNGNLWWGANKGLVRIVKTVADQFHIDEFPTGDIVISIFEDREHSLWVGTRYNYLKRFRKGTFTSYYNFKKFPPYLPRIFRDRSGTLWLGTSRGNLIRSNDGTFDNVTVFLPENDEPAKGISAIAEDHKGNLWVGTILSGVFRFHNGKAYHTALSQLPTNHRIYGIMCDSRTRLWVSTRVGLHYREKSDGPWTHLQKKDGLPDDIVLNVYEDKKKAIWVCTDNGLLHFPDGNPNVETAQLYLEGFDITSISEDTQTPGLFWLTTDENGLFRFRDGKWFQYTMEKGLPTNDIFSILEDELGFFWIGTPIGVIRINKQALNDFALKRDPPLKYTMFNESDGIYRSRCMRLGPNIAIRGSEGQFYFCTLYGVTEVHPNNITINKLPPPVVIDKIRIDGNTIDKTNTAAPDTPIPSFYDVESIHFHFAALTYLSPEKVKFKTKLTGYDTGWKMQSSWDKRSADYKNLPYGKYTFRVTACNSNGVWNTNGASYAFELKPHFHQTLLFKILLFSALAAFGFFLYKSIKEFRHLKNIENKYKSSNLQKEQAKEYLRKLKHLMNGKRLYRDETLSLQSLSQTLSVSHRVLSQLINEHMSMNFSDYINSYRIREAKKYLEDKANDLSNIEICFKVGFNSQTSFYRAFRKETDMSPSQYRKNASK